MSQRAFEQAGRAGRLKVTDFTPATGIGKFDAQYLPDQNKLNITVNFRYLWVQDRKKPEELPWHVDDTNRFRRAAKHLIEPPLKMLI